MTQVTTSSKNNSLLIVGSEDFCRRLSSTLTSSLPKLRILTGGYTDAWSTILTHRPAFLLLEIGFRYSERTHRLIRRLFLQLSERFKHEVYSIVALTSPEKLFFGGDLIFSSEAESSPSGYIDSFVASVPGAIPSLPSLTEQVIHALQMGDVEHKRRLDGKTALPALGQAGWVQSLADPQSRELWMRWLPRYASYTNENPIIIGETGTGKTNLAYALHLLSGRKGQFVSMTPRDFSSSELIQAELFGAVSGAYTGAVDKWGLVKSAEKGTLFIDELQSIDKELQGKLITFIESKVYRRVGSTENIDADVRFVFASNRSLYDMMNSGVLRDDFAYRLERVQLELLPLCKRRLDIAGALAYALAKVRRQRPHAFPVFGLTSEAYGMLFGHQWPGNLRQLENSVAQLCELADMQEAYLIDQQIVAHIFQSRLRSLSITAPQIVSRAALMLAQDGTKISSVSLEDAVDKFAELVRYEALEACGGEITKAAALLQDNQSVLELVAKSGQAKREIP